MIIWNVICIVLFNLLMTVYTSIAFEPSESMIWSRVIIGITLVWVVYLVKVANTAYVLKHLRG